MKVRNVYIVWLRYSSTEKRLSAVFSTMKAAQEYANKPDSSTAYACVVTQEAVYSSADDL